MDCYNYRCPFRQNSGYYTNSSRNDCDCVACPNRSDSNIYIMSNRTLTKEELLEQTKKRNSNG